MMILKLLRTIMYLKRRCAKVPLLAKVRRAKVTLRAKVHFHAKVTLCFSDTYPKKTLYGLLNYCIICFLILKKNTYFLFETKKRYTKGLFRMLI